MIDKTISHYKIIEKLGGGGMGVVYKAQDTNLDRTVALKFLPQHMLADKEAEQRFISEAKAASSLDHPNICTIHDINKTEDDQFYIVMGYYTGETLKKKLDAGPLKIDTAINYATQIAAGLASAHDAGIIHRDIKPANIMITDKDEAKILDFGLAKTSSEPSVTKLGSTVGTVSYMSPEQSKGNNVDQRTDIWSLGIILYEMVTGKSPFKGDYDQAVTYSIINEDPEPLTGLRTGVPMELERIVNKTLSKNSEERYQHADELLADLKKLQQELSISKKVYPHTKDTQKPSKSRLKPFVKYSGILIIIIIFSALVYFLYDQILRPIETESTIIQTDWENSIAVLPFENISSDPEQEYFCDGMTEQLITNLSRLQRLKVIARTSTMKFKGSKKTVFEIGKELKVSHILEGSVRKAGNRIRITAQLINTESGYHLWANDYEREMNDIFAIQDDVSVTIVNALFQKLSNKEIREIQTKRPANTEAYEYFLKARYFGDKYPMLYQLQDFKTSEAMYKKAIELDPNYAPSYAYLSDLYDTYIMRNPEEEEKFIHLVEKYIEIALNLDQNSVEVQFARATQLREPEKIIIGLKKVMGIDPNHFGANWQIGVYLRNIGLFYHSFPYFNRAIEVNPLFPGPYNSRGSVYGGIGEFDKAEQDFKFSLQIEPDGYWAMIYYMRLLRQLKKYNESEKLLNRFEAKYPDDVNLNDYKARLMAVKGDSLNALRLFEEGGFPRWDRIGLYLILDKKDEALTLMQERQNEEGKRIYKSRYLHFKHWSVYDNVRDDNRFKKMLEEEKGRYEILLEKYSDL